MTDPQETPRPLVWRGGEVAAAGAAVMAELAAGFGLEGGWAEPEAVAVAVAAGLAVVAVAAIVVEVDTEAAVDTGAVVDTGAAV